MFLQIQAIFLKYAFTWINLRMIHIFLPVSVF